MDALAPVMFGCPFTDAKLNVSLSDWSVPSPGPVLRTGGACVSSNPGFWGSSMNAAVVVLPLPPPPPPNRVPVGALTTSSVPPMEHGYTLPPSVQLEFGRL